jgi:hypothetical protein
MEHHIHLLKYETILVIQTSLWNKDTAFMGRRHTRVCIRTPSYQPQGLMKLDYIHAASCTVLWTDPASLHKLWEQKIIAIIFALSFSYFNGIFLWNTYLHFSEPLGSSKHSLGGKSALKQGRTYPGRQVTLATKFFTVAPNILRPQYGTCFMSLLAPRILRWFLDFWKGCVPLF